MVTHIIEKLIKNSWKNDVNLAEAAAAPAKHDIQQQIEAAEHLALMGNKSNVVYADGNYGNETEK